MEMEASMRLFYNSRGRNPPSPAVIIKKQEVSSGVGCKQENKLKASPFPTSLFQFNTCHKLHVSLTDCYRGASVIFWWGTIANAIKIIMLPSLRST
jgi:hypothetical protein